MPCDKGSQVNYIFFYFSVYAVKHCFK